VMTKILTEITVRNIFLPSTDPLASSIRCPNMIKE